MSKRRDLCLRLNAKAEHPKHQARAKRYKRPDPKQRPSIEEALERIRKKDEYPTK